MVVKKSSSSKKQTTGSTKKSTTRQAKKSTGKISSRTSTSKSYSNNSKTKKIHNEMLTIMFVDIVNYTKTTSQLSREVFNDLHDVFDTLVGETVEEYGGTIIKKIGDAFLITFRVATDAVHCGVTMQKKFKDYNEMYDLPMPLEIRVAIHAGDVMVKDNDIYGDAVNVTARIEGLAKPRTVVFSEVVYSSMNKGEIEYKYLGTRSVKGVKDPIRIFKAKTEEDFEREERRRRRLRQLYKAKKMQRVLSGVMIILLIAIITFFIIVYFNQLTSWL
jgi:class 3 adenylate cyclase